MYIKIPLIRHIRSERCQIVKYFRLSNCAYTDQIYNNQFFPSRFFLVHTTYEDGTDSAFWKVGT